MQQFPAQLVALPLTHLHVLDPHMLVELLRAPSELLADLSEPTTRRPFRAENGA